MATSRHLASIMFADIAGYTALMQDDERNALLIRNKLMRVLEEATLKYHGRVVEILGDGAICSFSSAMESVQAGIAIQQQMQAEPKVPLRIGLHSGDVIFDGDYVYGDGVNLASRIESFAVPGSVLISGKVYDEIKNHKEIETIHLGKFELKNVKDPVDLYAVYSDLLVVPDITNLKGKGRKVQKVISVDRSIFVLPFVNLSNDPDQDYFSDGLTEELITNLSRINDMKVTSRTTSMKYKGSDKDLKTMATENEAAYVLEGSVRKQNNHLRITAQLIDAMKDVHIWAESYRGTIDDIFDIQESVAEKIAAALQLHLTREEQQLLEKRYTDDTEAYELYLKGRHYWKQRNEEGLTKAIKYFERALQKDPDYALAFAGIADAYSLMGEYSNISRRELFPKQMAAVNKALALDNRLGEAHISKAISLMLNEWDWRNSERSFKRGIELSPRYATGHHWYAEWLLFMGYFEDALKQIELAVEHDPLSQGILKDKGIFYYYNGQFGSAIDMGLMTLQIKPEFAPVYRLLSLGYQGLEMFDEAEKYNAEWGKLIGNEIKTQVALADIYAQAGRTEEAWKIINEIEAGKNLSANDNRGMAQVYAGLNEKDMAFQYLNRSYALHEESLCSLKVDWKMDPLRDDKRFQDLLRRVNFEV